MAHRQQTSTSVTSPAAGGKRHRKAETAAYMPITTAVISDAGETCGIPSAATHRHHHGCQQQFLTSIAATRRIDDVLCGTDTGSVDVTSVEWWKAHRAETEVSICEDEEWLRARLHPSACSIM